MNDPGLAAHSLAAAGIDPSNLALPGYGGSAAAYGGQMMYHPYQQAYAMPGMATGGPFPGHPAMVEPAKPEVPPGWTAQYDASNSRFYYINNATLATQWEVPTEPVLIKKSDPAAGTEQKAQEASFSAS